MATVNLKQLVGKLNDTCRRSLEGAAGLCLSRTNYNVEIEHWLLKLLEVPNTDLAALLRYFEIDASRLAGDLTSVVDRFKTGNSRPPALNQNLVDLAHQPHAFEDKAPDGSPIGAFRSVRHGCNLRPRSLRPRPSALV